MKVSATKPAKAAVPAQGDKPAVPATAARTVEVDYDIPDDLAGLSKNFGETVVASAAKGAIVISLQSLMRRLIEKGKSQAEVQAEVKAWKPDTRTVSKQSAFEKASSSIEKLSPEERKSLLAKLQAAGVQK